MKKICFVLMLAILLTGSAVGIMSAPSFAQGFEGYNYPTPPQNPTATPWVGTNTPWTFFKGDWFLNGILQNFFGNQNGWAPYYAYPSTQIVRPNNWYEPKWNAWYQRNPHYWDKFQRQYPQWREHYAGRYYDQNFYNRYHRGQGGGWNQGFRGDRHPIATEPGVRPPAGTWTGHPPGTTGSGVRPPGATGSKVYGPGTTGRDVRHPEATDRGVRKPVATGPGARPPGDTEPVHHPPVASVPGVRSPGTTGPNVHGSRTTGSGTRPPEAATGPGGRKPGRIKHDEEKK